MTPLLTSTPLVSPPAPFFLGIVRMKSQLLRSTSSLMRCLTVVIGRLAHYGRVISFRRDRVADTIFNGVRIARMFIERPIPAQTFIAGEFVRFWYPSQLKTCRKCSSEDHLAAACKSQRCFNCERHGHCAE
ncbi:unnamed protein product [Porites evermanni]|uniref:Transposase n=1 Tax=Porites evermanni TaxID=104178 RepID=A0ABN8MEQ8_9CNID|nr:unnamed protein product [Porites evermanni]